MTYETLEERLLSQKGAWKDFPFGSSVAVFKVCAKMFAMVAWRESPLRITLKCDPDDAMALRDQNEAVQPGYYMNKRHWNTITLDGSIPYDEVLRMIDNSYSLVVRGLKKALRQELRFQEDEI